MDCIVHGVAKNWTQLSDFHFTLPFNNSSSYIPFLSYNLHLLYVYFSILFFYVCP